MLIKRKGFSLVELLISLLLGSLLLSMVISLYTTTVSSSAKSLKYSRLRTDLQSILSLMESDIRRAGYGGDEYLVGSGAKKTVDSVTTADQACVVYYYKHSANNSANKMGFRWDSDKKQIQFGTAVDPVADNCYDSGYWSAISDRQFIKVTKLAFTESEASNASATMRSVNINISAQLASESSIEYSISSRVQVRNVELN